MFKMDSENSVAAFLHMAFRIISRVFQFVLSLTVIGLYASTVEEHNYKAAWVFAVVAGTLSALTSAAYFVPKVQSYKFWAWDLILWIFFTGVFGSMGKIYIHPTGSSSRRKSLMKDTKMRNAVWVDCVLMILWFSTGVFGILVWLHRRRQNKKDMGAAHV